MAHTFTDRHLALLFTQLQNDFKDYGSKSIQEKCDLLYSHLDYALHDDVSSELYGLSETDKEQVYHVLYTFLDGVQSESHQQQRSYRFRRLNFQWENRHYYCHRHHFTHDYIYFPDFIFIQTSNSSSKNNNKNDNDAGSVLLEILLVFLLIMLMCLTVFALDYLMSEIQNNCERFIYNEGWLRAMVSFSTLAASTASVSVLFNVFLTPAFISLCASSTLADPTGVALASVICLSIVGSALSFAVANIGLSYAFTNSQALIPQDPARFSLTAAEISELESKNLDPIKVKCAIVALYEYVDKGRHTAGASFLFGRSQQTQAIISAVRKLRCGQLMDFKLSDYVSQPLLDLRFNCTKDAQQRYIPHAQEVEVDLNDQKTPSAPPADNLSYSTPLASAVS